MPLQRTRDSVTAYIKYVYNHNKTGSSNGRHQPTSPKPHRSINRICQLASIYTPGPGAWYIVRAKMSLPLNGTWIGSSVSAELARVPNSRTQTSRQEQTTPLSSSFVNIYSTVSSNQFCKIAIRRNQTLKNASSMNRRSLQSPSQSDNLLLAPLRLEHSAKAADCL